MAPFIRRYNKNCYAVFLFTLFRSLLYSGDSICGTVFFSPFSEKRSRNEAKGICLFADAPCLLNYPRESRSQTDPVDHGVELFKKFALALSDGVHIGDLLLRVGREFTLCQFAFVHPIKCQGVVDLGGAD